MRCKDCSQVRSYSLMQQTANNTGNAEGIAAVFSDITGGIKLPASIATLDFSSAAAPVGLAAQSAMGDPTGRRGIAL